MNFKQKGKIISYILKLSVLAFTVLPGANRVVLFYIISHVTTTEYFAFFSSAYSYAIVMSMIGGVGVGTVIIKYGSEFGIVNYIKIASIAIILSSIAGGIIIFSFWEVTRLGIIGLLLMSIGLTMNQIIRYMIIVKKIFLIGAINEVIFILPP
ncbi:O8 family O-antigen flippase, partial [Escherichia coli]|nr:O8 family O-antigen flippase [Escherichia coli]